MSLLNTVCSAVVLAVGYSPPYIYYILLYQRIYVPAYPQCMYIQYSLYLFSLTYLQQTTALEYAVVDKRKKKISKGEHKPNTGCNDGSAVENKMTQVCT